MEPADRWFDPASLYAEGFTGQATTALRMFPLLRQHLRQLVAEVRPRRALEVGPGDRALISQVPHRVYLDVARTFLEALDGQRVLGDALACPFGADTFDLVVAADVLTHVPADRRAAALAEFARLAPRVLLFVNAAGAAEVRHSGERIDDTEGALAALGMQVQRDDIPFTFPSGDVRRYATLLGVRRGVATRLAR
jgi:hypothetical protein